MIVTDITTLRQVSKPTTMEEVAELKLIERLEEATKTAWTPGVGLAAIQIGVPLRFAIYYMPKEDGSGKQVFYLLNPEIINREQKTDFKDEGCLSLPGKRFRTWRHFKIQYKNLNDDNTYEAEGFWAQVIQHEIDHFDGIVCRDRADKYFQEVSQRQKERIEHGTLGA